MKIGDTLIYGDGSRALIEGFPKINKQPGVMVKPDAKPLSLGDVMHYRHEVDLRLAQGVWTIEAADHEEHPAPCDEHMAQPASTPERVAEIVQAYEAPTAESDEG